MKRTKNSTNKKKNNKERRLTVLMIFLLVLTPVSIVFVKATLSEINYKVERIKKDIAYQEKINEGLEMKINELASLDNIQNIIHEEGLTYNNDNIKNVRS